MLTIFDRTIMKPFVAITPKWLPPNYITAFRLIMVPVVVWLLILGNYKIAGIVFILAAFSDAVDGAVARTRNQITDFGKIFDPIADKLLIISAGAVLIVKFLPIWIFIFLFLLELAIVTKAAVTKFGKKKPIQANIFGKIKMVLQCFGISFIFIFSAFYQNPALISIAFYTLSMALVFALLSLCYDKRGI